MSLAQLLLQTQVVWGLTFLLSVLAGVLFHRGHFCTMGAISDWIIMGDRTRAKQWGLAMAVAILGFGVLTWRGLINPFDSIYGNSQLSWLSFFLGGSLFGAGMVLASGCASKSLVRLGAGNLKSLVVLMAMGIAALATLKGLSAVWRVAYLDPVTVPTGPGPFLPQWLASATAWSLPLSWLLVSVLLAGALFWWVFGGVEAMPRWAALSGAGVGAVVVSLWWVSGVVGHVPEHPETLEAVFLTTASGRMESLSLTAPVASSFDALMYFSDGSKRLTLGMVTALGLVVGTFFSALLQGTFRWEGFSQTPDLAGHLMGGGMMGVGGVLAMGCTMGQGLSGLSTLSLGSFVAVGGIVCGAVLALQWQLRRAERAA